MEWTQEKVKLLLGRFYQTSRLGLNIGQRQWDIDNQKNKKPMYPTSFEIMEILAVNSWDDVLKIAEDVTNEWRTQLNKTDVRKDILEHLNQLNYLELLRPYKDHMKTAQMYADYRMNEAPHLPSVPSIIAKFDTWNQFKKALFKNDDTTDIFRSGRKPTYTDEELIAILKEHTKNVPFSQWKEYAEQHGLPHRLTFIKRLTKAQLAPYLSSAHLESDELLNLVWKHREAFSTLSVRKWTVYANEHNLPTKATFIRHFSKEKHNLAITYLAQADATLNEFKALMYQ